MSSTYKPPHTRGDSETVKFDDSTAYGGGYGASELSYHESSSRPDSKGYGGGGGGGDLRGDSRGDSRGYSRGGDRGYSRGGSGGGSSRFGTDRYGGDRESRGDRRFGRDDDGGFGRRGSDRGGYGGSYGRRDRDRGGRGGGGGGGGRRRGGGGGGRRFSSFSDRARYDVEDEDEIFGEAAVEQGIKFEEYEELEVEVGGDRIPRAIDDFDQAEFPEQLAKNVARVGYKLPTPIQKHCVPFACDMRDVMACAQTGSGKTAAFLLPIVHCMMLRGIQEERVEGRRGRIPAPAAVILSPTRELAIQIHGHARKFCYHTGLRPVVIYGGAERRKQMRDLGYGVDLLVATPGRLNDFLESGTLTLEKCMFCVLDEADRMLDMGFMPQIEGIINDMPAKELRQTLMFSATFPAEIQQLAAEFLKDDYLFISVGRVGAATTLVKQELRYAEQREKLRELLEMLPGLKGLKLVFVETRREADTVEHQLVRNSIDAISIHGDRSQYEREHALAMFKSGKTQVLVATDVAARGLDIPDVMYVINYDLPNNIDSYVHRIGRTGRCGNEGTAISFVHEGNYPIFKDLLEILTEAKQKVPSWFETMAERSGRGGGRGRRGGRRGGKGGGTRYGGRDHRVSSGKGKSQRYTHGGRSGGRGGDRGGGGGGGGGFGDFYERDAW